MNKNSEQLFISSEELRDPDICIGNFELWVYGRQFPDSDEYWDGNWLDVLARCTGASSIVHAAGPILHLSELEKLLRECRQMDATLSGEAHLDCMEPNLDLKITMQNRGRLELSVSITPDHLNQEHSFIFDLDQSYLLPFIKKLETLLHMYSLRGLHDR